MQPIVTRRLLACSLAGLLAIGAGLAAADWPCFHGPNRDLISNETGWTHEWPGGKPNEVWRVSVGIGFSSVSVAGGRVYTMGNVDDTDIVWCLDAKSGETLWTHKYPCKEGSYPGPRMTPTVDGDLVFTLGRDGQLYGLNARSGKPVWYVDIAKEYGVKQSKFKWGLACSPLVLGDLLILDTGRTLALLKKTGKLAWASGRDNAGFSSPTAIQIGGKTFINCFNAYGLVLVNAADGKELGRMEWETEYEINSASPIPSGDKLFISSGYGKGCALVQVGPKGLSPVYQNREMRNHCNSSVLYKDFLYGFDGQQGSTGRLACLEFATGQVKWAQRGMKVGSLMIADGKIIAMLDGGDLLIAEASPDAYKELARAKVLGGQCWTYPVLCGGRIYCRSNEGAELVCLDAGGK